MQCSLCPRCSNVFYVLFVLYAKPHLEVLWGTGRAPRFSGCWVQYLHRLHTACILLHPFTHALLVQITGNGRRISKAHDVSKSGPAWQWASHSLNLHTPRRYLRDLHSSGSGHRCPSSSSSFEIAPPFRESAAYLDRLRAPKTSKILRRYFQR